MTRIFFMAGLLLASLFSTVQSDNNDRDTKKQWSSSKPKAHNHEHTTNP